MTEQNLTSRAYTIIVSPPADANDGYQVTYAPRGSSKGAALSFIANEQPRQVIGPFEVVVLRRGEDVSVR